MRQHEIESWVYDIIERVQKCQPIEDSGVELKSEWIDPTKAARQIAGHANAARGKPILWLIGINEKEGTIPGVYFKDFASWYDEVKAKFDELAPEPIFSINIPTSGVTVAALYFETDRAPYVVKNSEGGTVQRELPWREATGTKSATRSQLLRLLSPLLKLPDLEVVGSFLNIRQDVPYQINVTFNIALFLTQPTEQQIVIPSHHCKIEFGITENGNLNTISGIYFKGDGSANISATKNAVSIQGSGLFETLYRGNILLKQGSKIISDRDVQVDLLLRPVHIEHPIKIETILPLVKKGHWYKGNYNFT